MILALPSWKRNYYLYQTANFISLMGDFLGGMALHWWILNKSDDMTGLSSIFLVGNVVSLVSLPLLGPIGDRFCRKNLLNYADMVSCSLCIILAAFIYHDNAHILWLCLLSGLLSFANALFRAGNFGMIADLVPKQHFSWAISQNHIVLTVSIILGGSIGSLIISLVGIFYTMIINAIAIFIAVILIRNVRVISHATNKKSSLTLKEWGSDFIKGIQFVGQEKILLISFILIVLISALLTPFDFILPYYVQKVRLLSIWHLGLLESSIGIGSITGSLIFTFGLIKNNALSTIICALVMMSMALFFFGFFESIIILITLGFIFGMGEVLFFVPIRTKLMLMLPYDFRSRVGVIFSFGQQIGKPLAITMTALMIKSFAVSSILAGLAILIVMVVPIILLLPAYAHFLGLPSRATSAPDLPA